MNYQRKTIFFIIVLATGLLCVTGGIIEAMSNFIDSLYIIMVGIGIILLNFGITESRKKLSKYLLILSFLSYSFAFFAFSYSSYKVNHQITALVFTLSGILLLIFTLNFSLKRGEVNYENLH